MNCVQHLEEIAALQEKDDMRFTLEGAAHQIRQAVTNLYHYPSVENMRHLNNVWAYAIRVIAVAQAPVQPAPKGGKA